LATFFLACGLEVEGPFRFATLVLAFFVALVAVCFLETLPPVD